jgi:hypothetical protein
MISIIVLGTMVRNTAGKKHYLDSIRKQIIRGSGVTDDQEFKGTE